MKNVFLSVVAVVMMALSLSAEAQMHWFGEEPPPGIGDLVYCAGDSEGPCLPYLGEDDDIAGWYIDTMMDNVYCVGGNCANQAGSFTLYNENGSYGTFLWTGLAGGGYTLTARWSGSACYHIFQNACNGGPPEEAINMF